MSSKTVFLEEKMVEARMINWRQIAYIFAGGFLGILSTLPLLPRLIEATGETLSVPMPVVQTVSVIQSSVFLLILVVLGGWLAPQLNLKTPIITATINRHWEKLDLRPILISALVGGTIGGLLITVFYGVAAPFLPAEFIENSATLSLPIYTRLLYGGITEEVLIRWGLMSLLVWLLYRLTQQKGTQVKGYNYIFGIVVSDILFGVGHLPDASLLSPVVTSSFVVYIIIGNTLYGLNAGYLFWKRGLESAILAHMIAHIVMVFGEAVLG